MKRFAGTKSHPVLIEGFMLGTFYKAGQSIDLNWKQSREFQREGRVSDPGSASNRLSKKEKN